MVWNYYCIIYIALSEIAPSEIVNSFYCAACVSLKSISDWTSGIIGHAATNGTMQYITYLFLSGSENLILATLETLK